MNQSIDQLSINTIRTLSMDAVQQANSGHPGTPMSMAPVIVRPVAAPFKIRPGRSALAQPRPLRAVDRPCLDVALFDAAPGRRARVDSKHRGAQRADADPGRIKKFRQLDSKTPGHPEYGLDAGVETTTGPLGQGVATASAWRSPRNGSAAISIGRASRLFDFDVYALCGDGDMMEGDQQRSGVARRPFETRQPVLDLRQQPDLHRRQHQLGASRRCRQTLRGLWLERFARRRCQRPSRPRWRACEISGRRTTGRR